MKASFPANEILKDRSMVTAIVFDTVLASPRLFLTVSVATRSLFEVKILAEMLIVSFSAFSIPKSDDILGKSSIEMPVNSHLYVMARPILPVD